MSAAADGPLRTRASRSLRVVITTQVFPPEIHPTAIMVAQLARRLAGAGHLVTVVAGRPHHPDARMFPDSRALPLLQRARLDGYTLVRASHPVFASRRIALRGATMMGQTLAQALAAVGAGRADVIINYGPPLLGTIAARGVATLAGAKVVGVVYDLYPDVVIDTGNLKNPVGIALARGLERACYRSSDRVLVLSHGFRRELARRGVPDEKIVVLPVWLEQDEIRPLPRDTSFRRAHGIGPEKTVVLYAGTIGLVSGAKIVLDAAASLRDRPNVLFLFVGEGGVRRELEAEAQARGLANTRFLPFQPRELLPEVQASSDISLVTLSPGAGRNSVPSKVVGYMAAGRPVVASVDSDSDTAELVRESACGVVVAPGEPAPLAAAIRALADDEEARRRAGDGARRAFERTFAADAVLDGYLSMLEGLAAPGRSP